MPFVMAEDISLPGCSVALVGINSLDPGGVYSSQCERTSPRMLRCQCIDNTLGLYSKNEEVGHNLIIQYNDNGVIKTRQVSDIRLSPEPINTEAAFLILRLVAGLIFIPLFLFVIIIIIYTIRKKRKNAKT